MILELVVVLGAVNGDAAGGDGVGGAAGCLGVPSRRPCVECPRAKSHMQDKR